MPKLYVVYKQICLFSIELELVCDFILLNKICSFVKFQNRISDELYYTRKNR